MRTSSRSSTQSHRCWQPTRLTNAPERTSHDHTETYAAMCGRSCAMCWSHHVHCTWAWAPHSTLHTTQRMWSSGVVCCLCVLCARRHCSRRRAATSEAEPAGCASPLRLTLRAEPARRRRSPGHRRCRSRSSRRRQDRRPPPGRRRARARAAGRGAPGGPSPLPAQAGCRGGHGPRHWHRPTVTPDWPRPARSGSASATHRRRRRAWWGARGSATSRATRSGPAGGGDGPEQRPWHPRREYRPPEGTGSILSPGPDRPGEVGQPGEQGGLCGVGPSHR